MRRLRPIEYPLARCRDGMNRRAFGLSSGTTRGGPYARSACAAYAHGIMALMSRTRNVPQAGYAGAAILRGSGALFDVNRLSAKMLQPIGNDIFGRSRSTAALARTLLLRAIPDGALIDGIEELTPSRCKQPSSVGSRGDADALTTVQAAAGRRNRDLQNRVGPAL